MQKQIDRKVDLETFYGQAPRFNANASKIAGVVCGYRVEEIGDKLVDEPAKGKSMEKILRP